MARCILLSTSEGWRFRTLVSRHPNSHDTISLLPCSAPIRFSPDGSLLVAFCGIVHIWDIRKRKVDLILLFHIDDVYALTFSADSASVVTLDSDAERCAPGM